MQSKDAPPESLHPHPRPVNASSCQLIKSPSCVSRICSHLEHQILEEPEGNVWPCCQNWHPHSVLPLPCDSSSRYSFLYISKRAFAIVTLLFLPVGNRSSRYSHVTKHQAEVIPGSIYTTLQLQIAAHVRKGSVVC